MCCRYVELPLARRLSRDEQKWIALHPGMRIIDRLDHHVVRFEVACGALAPDGRCTLYGKPERPEMCAHWPDYPEEQTPPGCVYREPELKEKVEISLER